MRLLILSHVSDFIGGAEKSLMDIIDVWRREDADLDVRFIVRKPLRGLERELDARKIIYYGVDYTYWSDANLPDTADRIFTSSVRNTRATKRIEQIIDDFIPDVVLTNSIIAPWAALAAHYKNVPHVWMVREYGMRDHGRAFEIGEKETFEDIGYLSDLVLTNSLTLREFAGRYISKQKLQTIYTPFDIDKLQAQAKAKVNSPFRDGKSLKVVLTGNVAPGKGHDILTEAIGILNETGINTEVCFIGRKGAPKYMAKISSIIDKYQISKKVHMVGFQQQPLPIVKKADVAVMASAMEAFGRVTFEYAAIGLPVCGSSSGATPEIVVDGETGYLYKRGDAADLADKLARYSAERKLLRQHGDRAIVHAREMMVGNYSAHSALKAIRKAAKNHTATPTLHYAHRWLDYPENAVTYMSYQNDASLVKLLKERTKNRLRPHYHKLKKASLDLKGRFNG